MRKAAVAALKSATVRAKLLAEQEEREIQKLMNTVINSQIKKIEIKLSYCAEQDKVSITLKSKVRDSLCCRLWMTKEDSWQLHESGSMQTV